VIFLDFGGGETSSEIPRFLEMWDGLVVVPLERVVERVVRCVARVELEAGGFKLEDARDREALADAFPPRDLPAPGIAQGGESKVRGQFEEFRSCVQAYIRTTQHDMYLMKNKEIR
jgi:hypothetical protein